jgi:glutamate-1-semialdehyde 2,1-aminomutase
VLGDTVVIPYNRPDVLDRVLEGGDVACFIVEPVMENIGICLPEPGYLEAVREITRRHGTLLIFDEVKTGITAGWGGATGALGVQPDLVSLAKSIGGGLPIGAFGGRQEYMDSVAAGKVLHLGTYNGNPLVMAATKAVLAEVCTPEATQEAIDRNRRYLDACDAIIAERSLPAHTVQFGAKGCITWSPDPVRNYRDYKATDFDLAFAQWLWGINRGVLLPPGLDEQWLISVMHDDDDIAHGVEVFRSFADAVTA